VFPLLCCILWLRINFLTFPTPSSLSLDLRYGWCVDSGLGVCVCMQIIGRVLRKEEGQESIGVPDSTRERRPGSGH
jgi:hypothetical protein